MSDGLNRAQLLGNLGADPDLRFGQGPDSAVLKLRIATTESYLDRRTNERKERTDWHSAVCFGRRAEGLAKVLTKGSRVYIEGRLQTSSYEKDGQKHYRTEIVISNVLLCGGPRPEGERRPAQRPPSEDFDDRGYPAPHVGPQPDIADSDIPF